MQAIVEVQYEHKSKLRIRLGAVELEYEGDVSFTKEDVTALIDKMVDLAGARRELQAPEVAAESNGKPIQLPPNAVCSFNHSTNTIATLLDAKSGGDLVMAAVAHLSLVKGLDTVKRSEIAAEMQAAKFLQTDHVEQFEPLAETVGEGSSSPLGGNRDLCAVSQRADNAGGNACSRRMTSRIGCTRES